VSGSVGQPLARVDGRAKVTGKARYAAEARPARLAHAVLVKSTVAKGRVLAVDTAAARSAPGVLLVMTHENAPKLTKPPEKPQSPQDGKLGETLLPFSTTEIHFVGQDVACVVAETPEQARRAAALVKVRYETARPTLSMEEAGPGEAPKQALGGVSPQHKRGDPDAALAAAGAVKVTATYRVPVETNNPMETSATVAEWTGDRLLLHDSTQSVVGTKRLVAQLFGITAENVRVVCPYTGGGFGGKGHQWPHTVIAAMAARTAGRPVSLVLTRPQMFTSSGHRPPTVHEIALAATSDGTLTAVRHVTVNATSPVTEFVAPCGAVTSKKLYACENVETVNRLVRVNVAAPTPMRAPAESPGTFAIESAMDELAYALKMDPVELRRKNHAAKDPSNGKPWSSKHLLECYERGAEIFRWKERTPAPRSMTDRGLLVGMGMATAFYPAHRRAASARIRLFPDGHALVSASTQELGTGSYTVFTQVAADALGLPVERVTFELGDTDLPEAPFSAGSLSAASVSEAILKAAENLKPKLAGWDRSAPVEAEAHVEPPDEKTKPATTQSFGAQFCEVRIDPLLPRVQVTRVVSVHDVGLVLNRRTAASQIVGGVVMGIGMALMEETVYDRRTGRVVNDNLADYRVPVNADVPEIAVDFVGAPDTQFCTLGCRGAGEIGITGVAAAIANAVYHATGRRLRELPITPEKLL
jgi:xanthine dehydrogenase YagR molybdenum-binding subunit